MQKTFAHSVYNRSLLLRFLLVFACLSSAIASAIYFYSYQRFHLRQEQLERAESVLLERAARTLQRDLREVVADIRRVGHSQILRDYLKIAGPAERSRLEKEFVNLARYAGIYDQVWNRSGSISTRAPLPRLPLAIYRTNLIAIISAWPPACHRNRYIFHSWISIWKTGWLNIP